MKWNGVLPIAMGFLRGPSCAVQPVEPGQLYCHAGPDLVYWARVEGPLAANVSLTAVPCGARCCDDLAAAAAAACGGDTVALRCAGYGADSVRPQYDAGGVAMRTAYLKAAGVKVSSASFRFLDHQLLCESFAPAAHPPTPEPPTTPPAPDPTPTNPPAPDPATTTTNPPAPDPTSPPALDTTQTLQLSFTTCRTGRDDHSKSPFYVRLNGGPDQEVRDRRGQAQKGKTATYEMQYSGALASAVLKAKGKDGWHVCGVRVGGREWSDPTGFWLDNAAGTLQHNSNPGNAGKGKCYTSVDLLKLVAGEDFET